MSDLREARVLLTDQDVRGWTREAARIKGNIEELQGQLAELERKIGAASALFPELLENTGDALSSHGAKPEVRANNEQVPFPLAIKKVLGTGDAAASPSEIRKRLLASGFGEKIKSSPNYFYTVLSRMTQKGQLIRAGDKYRLPNGSSSEEETRASGPGLFKNGVADQTAER